MADYRLKYRGGFRSPMREELSFDVLISERDYAGDVLELPLTGDRVVITQGAADDDELRTFKPSTCTLSVLCKAEGEPFMELYTLDPTRYKVLVGECRDGVCLNRWTGYISTGIYSQPNDLPPYGVEIECNDGLEVLKNTSYTQSNGTPYTDVLTVRELLLRLLSPIEGGLDLWNFFRLTPEQAGNTFDIVTLSSDAVYSAVGTSEPSHYEVLDKVLASFGLQMFQRYGSWCVRSLALLPTAVRPEWFGDTATVFGREIATSVPLYSDNGGGEGLSTSAMLSMLPPLRKIDIKWKSRTDIALDLAPDKWGFIGRFNTPSPEDVPVSTIGYKYIVRGTEGVRLGYYPSRDYVSEKLEEIFIYPLDGKVSTPSSNVLTEITAKMYNLLDTESTIYVGLMAVDAGLDPRHSFDMREFWANRIKALGAVRVWRSDTKEWGWIPSNAYVGAQSALTTGATAVQLSAAPKPIPWRQRASLIKYTPTSLSLVAEGYPDLETEGMRFALYITGNGAWGVEMTEAQLSVSVADGISGEEKASTFEVSRWGASDASLEEAFVSGNADIAGCGLFAPALTVASSGMAVRSFVNPSLRSTAVEAVASTLRAMRNDITRQIDGEVYKALPIDLNTVWRTREGRFYYPNAITWRLLRGVYDMQLRELLPLRAMTTTTVGNAPWSAYVALDGGIIYRTPSSPTIRHLNPVSGDDRPILSTTLATIINSGYCCACVVEEEDATNHIYNLYAYDDTGKVVSIVIDLYNAVTKPTTDKQITAMAHSARYDTSTATWVVVGNVDDKSLEVRISVLDSRGALIVEKTKTLLGRVGASAELLVLANAFVINTEATDGSIITYWHNHALHSELELVQLSQGSARKVAVNDTFVIEEWGDGLKIGQRSGVDVQSSATLYEPGEQWSLVSANSALVLMRNTAGNAQVYDARTGAIAPISTSTLSVRFALVGDVVYILGDGVANSLKAVRIVEGDGYFGAIDADGAELYDANNNRVMIKRYELR